MDFYYKYSKKPKVLCASFWKSGHDIKLYFVEKFKYVVTKDRSVMFESYFLNKAEDRFFKEIYMEANDPLLFND